MAKNTRNEQIAHEVTEIIKAELAKGIIPWMKPWANDRNGSCHNLASGYKYNLLNNLLLKHSPWRDPDGNHGYLTFKQAKELGAHVRKGAKAEKAIQFFPTKYVKKDELGNVIVDEDGNEQTRTYIRMTYALVFWEDDIEWWKPVEVSEEEYEAMTVEERHDMYYRIETRKVEDGYHYEKDSDGKRHRVPNIKKELVMVKYRKEPVKKPTRNKTFHTDPLAEGEELIKNYSEREHIAIYRDKPSNEAFYSPKADYIKVPMISQYRNANEYYSTVFHEMTHSTGHKSRLNRITDTAFFGNHEYSREELVAELGSAMCCMHCGISTDRTMQNSTAYIQSWMNALANDDKAFVWACAKAEKAFNFILGNKESAH